MALPIFRAAPPESLIVVRLDVLSAVYHRPSGITHLLAAPAPEILKALAEPGDLASLRVRLADRYELTDGNDEALQARIDELVAAGLVSAS